MKIQSTLQRALTALLITGISVFALATAHAGQLPADRTGMELHRQDV